MHFGREWGSAAGVGLRFITESAICAVRMGLGAASGWGGVHVCQFVLGKSNLILPRSSNTLLNIHRLAGSWENMCENQHRASGCGSLRRVCWRNMFRGSYDDGAWDDGKWKWKVAARDTRKLRLVVNH